jgi:peptide deformylase
MSGPGVLPIVECGDPVLRRPAEPVTPADLRTGELQLLIEQMRATTEAAPGVGLTAPQVGVPGRSPEDAAATLGFTLT